MDRDKLFEAVDHIAEGLRIIVAQLREEEEMPKLMGLPGEAAHALSQVPGSPKHDGKDKV